LNPVKNALMQDCICPEHWQDQKIICVVF